VIKLNFIKNFDIIYIYKIKKYKNRGDMYMTIKERLEAGTTAEQMMNEFSDQLREAQAEIAAQKDNKLTEMRQTLINTIVDYTVATGIVTREDIADEDIAKLNKMFIEVEEEAAALAKFAKLMEALDEKHGSEDSSPRVKVKKLNAEDADKVIGEFLKRLG
jgi:hypothetical protein